MVTDEGFSEGACSCRSTIYVNIMSTKSTFTFRTLSTIATPQCPHSTLLATGTALPVLLQLDSGLTAPLHAN